MVIVDDMARTVIFNVAKNDSFIDVLTTLKPTVNQKNTGFKLYMLLLNILSLVGLGIVGLSIWSNVSNKKVY